MEKGYEMVGGLEVAENFKWEGYVAYFVCESSWIIVKARKMVLGFVEADSTLILA